MLKEDELDKLRRAGRISGEAREIGMEMCEPGVKLYDVAQEVDGYIREHGCKLAFPCNISRNDIAAHYTPSCTDKSKLEMGDVVKIDCGGHIDGWLGDNAGTVEVGTHTYTGLIAASKNARDTVEEFLGAGVEICEVGRAVEMSVKAAGYKVVENLCGHSIEQYGLHAGLTICNYDDGNTDKFKNGMICAIEPFVTDGGGSVVNGRPGGIVQYQRDRPLKDPKDQEFLDYVKEEFCGFPFCARNCEFPNAEKHVKKLVRLGLFSSYALLMEIKGGMVAQFEHSFYISGPKAELMTPP